jgi:hypothetical protein
MFNTNVTANSSAGMVHNLGTIVVVACDLFAVGSKLITPPQVHDETLL